jgi:hypothetical protein
MKGNTSGDQNLPFAQEATTGVMLTKPATGGGGAETAPADAQPITQALGSVYCAWQVSVTTAAKLVVPAWVAATAYLKGEVVTNDSGKMYRCTVAGTSAGSGGPTGSGSGNITDNGVTWLYVESFSLGFALSNPSDDVLVYVGQHSGITTSAGSSFIPKGGAKPMPYGNPSGFYLRAASGTVLVSVEAGL